MLMAGSPLLTCAEVHLIMQLSYWKGEIIQTMFMVLIKVQLTVNFVK